MSKQLDITGQKFNRLTAIKFINYHINPNGTTHILWLFKCECGTEKIIRKYQVINGHTKSCGCICKEKPSALVHGLSSGRFYKNWISMKARCYNPKTKHFQLYGGRGIKVCDRWLNFINFKNDMYQSYLEHVKKFGKNNTSIDRFPNQNGNYCPENTRWSNSIEQANNKQNNHFLTFNEQTLTIAQWEKKLNFNSRILGNRINRSHWSTEKALTFPIKKLTKSS